MERRRPAPPIVDHVAEAGSGGCTRCGVARRTVLMGVGAVGVAGLLAACGSGDDASGAASPSRAPTPSPDAPTSDSAPTSEAPASPSEPPSASPAAAGLVSTADVPVGGGVILDREGIVVTQPTQGQFMAFSSTCTHQGCSVTEVADGLISCPCHGSEYSVTDGSVRGGPAPAPLPEVAIVVEGSQIVRG